MSGERPRSKKLDKLLTPASSIYSKLADPKKVKGAKVSVTKQRLQKVNALREAKMQLQEDQQESTMFELMRGADE